MVDHGQSCKESRERFDDVYGWRLRYIIAIGLVERPWSTERRGNSPPFGDVAQLVEHQKVIGSNPVSSIAGD